VKESRTIAYVLHCLDKGCTASDIFWLELLSSITESLYAQNYDLLIIHLEEAKPDWVNAYLETGRVDGFILLTSSDMRRNLRSMQDIGAPFILWGPPDENLGCCTVSGDDPAGGTLATEYLIRSGRQRIAFLGGPADEIEVQSRYAGYQSALKSAGRKIDPHLVDHGDYSTASGATAMERLLRKSPDLDAVFVNSDVMAVTAIKTLVKHGRRVPEDVAVIGYDDVSISSLTTPALTTIRQNIPQAGKLLATNLIQYLKTGIVTHVTLPVELVIRESA
jgi:DNA-binding LacI/PurR family transcriptional regulator